MLKKHSKLVVLLVMVTFLFSFTLTASAAKFSDVAGASAEANAIYKLNSLGIIDGYPDGTFGPDNTITRAEFAKIAVYTAGLQNVASGMKSSPSTFKDVATSDWFNGWVNVAAAQGFVKGYSDGNFYPNKEVTQAEAVTVLLRILGYNDNLAGNWPSDYIGKAANLGLLDDVTFDAYGPATRGVVSVFAAETLDQDVQVYKASDNVFEKPVGGKTLLEEKFKDWDKIVEEQLVSYVTLTDNKIKFTFTDMTKAPGAAGRSVIRELAPNCTFANADFWGGAAFRFVDYILDDDDKVAYVKVLDYKVLKNVALDDIELKTAYTGAATPGEIAVDDKTYKVAVNFGPDTSDPLGAGVGAGIDHDANVLTPNITAGYLNNAAANATLEAWFLGNWMLYGDAADLVLNEDDEVAFVRGYAYPGVRPAAATPGGNLIRSVGIVDQAIAKSGKVTLVSGGGQSILLDPDETDGFYITKNGAPAKFEDIKKGDLVYAVNKFSLTPSGTSADGGFIIAMDATVKGKLTSFEKWGAAAGTNGIAVKKITVGDKVYNIASGSFQGGGLSWKSSALFSDDNGDSFAAADITNVEDVLGNEVTLYLNPIGEVAAIVTGAGSGDASKIYAVVNDDSMQTLANGRTQNAVEVLKADGTLVTYTYDDDSEFNGVNPANKAALDAAIVALTPGDFVEITLTSKGFIDKLSNDVTAPGNITGTSQVAGNITGDEDNKTVTIGGITYDASKVVVYDIDAVIAGTDDAEVTKVADFLDAADGTLVAGPGGNFTAPVTIKAKDGVLQYIVIDSTGGIGGKGNLAMVAGTGVDSDGDYALFLQKDGTTKKVYLDTGAALATKKSLIYYNMGADEADVYAWNDGANVLWEIEDVTYTVSKVSGNIITFVDNLGATWQFAVDVDTLYFDASDDDPAVAELADIATGDTVKVYKNFNEAIGAIVLQ